MSQVRPVRAKVRQLLLGTATEAQEVRQRLDQGEDFIALSQQVSRVPNAASGGDLGFLSQGSLPAELDEVIFALEAGEISQPVQGPSGFHIFQVLEIVPAGPPARSEVEGVVIRELRQEGARVFIRECIADLADEVGVTLEEDRLWFRYDGRYAKGGKGAH
jgi:parvulin-like peptidyl-prolyl isomerase